MGEVNVNEVSDEGQAPQGAKIARRTIVKGAAWSIPVIAVAAAVPGASASVSSLVAVSVAPNAVTVKPNDVLVTREVETTVTVKLADGSPDTSAKVVTVVVGGGLKLADGTTTYTYTGSASSFTIPAANRVTGERAGSGTITATVTSAATAPSTTLPVTVSPGAFYSMGGQAVPNPFENATGVVGASNDATRAGQPAIFDSFYPVSNLPAGVTVSKFSQGGYTAQGFAVTTDGGLIGWGRNNNYDLGTGSNNPTTALSPVEVLPAGSGVVQVESMEDGVIILKSDGSVLTVTGNAHQSVNGGNGGLLALTPEPALTAPGVPLTGIKKVSAVTWGGYALAGDGSVYSWGSGSGGANGNGSEANNLHATKIAFPPGVTIVDIAGASRGLDNLGSGKAVDSEGNVWTWGRDGASSNGPLGLSGMGTDSLVPVKIPGLTGVEKIWGDQTGFAARTTAGDVYVWGNSLNSSVLGLGTSGPTPMPTLNPHLHGADRVVFTEYGGSALFPDGTVKTWGDGTSGYGNAPLNGNGGPLGVPTTVPGFSNVTDIGGYRWGMFVKGDYVSPIPVPTRDRGTV